MTATTGWTLSLEAPIELGVVPLQVDGAIACATDDLGLAERSRTPSPGGGSLVRFDLGGVLLKLVCLDEPPTEIDGYGDLLVPGAGSLTTRAVLGLDVGGSPGGSVEAEVTGPDLEALREFWGGHLGFSDPGDGSLARDGLTLRLVEGAGPERSRLTERAGLRYLTLVVPDLAEAHDELTFRGVRFPMKPTELPNGAQIALAVDPAGHWVELGSRPK